MKVHGAGCFAQVAIAAEVCFEGVDEGTVSAGVGVEKGTEGLLVEIVEFTLADEVEEEAVDAEVRE